MEFDIAIQAIKTQDVKREIKEALGSVSMFIGEEHSGSKYEHLTILGFIDDFNILINNGVISKGYLNYRGGTIMAGYNMKAPTIGDFFFSGSQSVTKGEEVSWILDETFAFKTSEKCRVFN